jgi:hypothetical protein
MVKIPVDASKKSVFGSNLWFPKRAGKGPHGISAEPRFVGSVLPLVIAPASPRFVPDFERARAYRLAEDSPCVDKGVEVGLPFTGSAPDLGAFEFGSETILGE